MPDDEPALPLLDADAFTRTCKSFREQTGVGSDGFHPRVWGGLSAEGARTMVNFIKLVEDSMLWPNETAWIFYFLIPKLTGGLRPIGLMASFVRTWERMRRPVMQEWLSNRERSYDRARVGRTAESAVWQQLVQLESLDCSTDDDTTEVAAAVLLDLVKCFEEVQLIHVWRWGCYWGVPRRLLWVILGVFAFQRRIVVDGAHSIP